MNKKLKPKYIFPKLDKKRNGIICLECGKILVSFHRHDYKTCGCDNETMIDGGSDYLRYGAKDFNKIQLIEILPLKD